MYSLMERIQVWEDGGRMCHYCDKPLPRPGTKMGKMTHLDHKHAQSKGGSDDLDNLLVCCKVCNREKGKKDYEVYLHDRLNQAKKQVLRLSKLLARHNNEDL
jgi:5-methylcytosine-specific restriction endonuclease McrA